MFVSASYLVSFTLGLVERYAFFEDTYLQQKKALRGQLRVKIITLLRKLYESILSYLLETAIYYDRENASTSLLQLLKLFPYAGLVLTKFYRAHSSCSCSNQ